MRFLKEYAYFVLAISTVLVAVAHPSGASEAAKGGNTSSTLASRVCLMNIDTASHRCFSDIRALVNSLTNGRIDNIETAEELRDRRTIKRINTLSGRRHSRSCCPNKVVAQFWDDYRLNGSSYVYYSSTGCDGDAGVEKSMGVLPEGWRNRFASGQGYAKCQFRVWDGDVWMGDYFGYTGYSGSFQGMADRANSFRLR